MRAVSHWRLLCLPQLGGKLRVQMCDLGECGFKLAVVLLKLVVALLQGFVKLDQVPVARAQARIPATVLRSVPGAASSLGLDGAGAGSVAAETSSSALSGCSLMVTIHTTYGTECKL
jgi:hypothetical protein